MFHIISIWKSIYKTKKLVYATLHGTGYWLLPMCEKIHSLLNIAPIIKNKVTFLGQDICPHDKSLLGTKKIIYITYLGPFMANFAHFSPIFESHWNKRPTCPLNYFYYIVPYVLYIYIVWNICFVNRKNQKLLSFIHWKYTFPPEEAKRP